jgi:hypothetical protein
MHNKLIIFQRAIIFSTIILNITTVIQVALNFTIDFFLISIIVFKIIACGLTLLILSENSERFLQISQNSMTGIIGLNIGFTGAGLLFSIIVYSQNSTNITIDCINVQSAWFICLMAIICFMDKVPTQEPVYTVVQNEPIVQVLTSNDELPNFQPTVALESIFNCPVCLSDNLDEIIVETVCKHTFHEKCIKTWARNNSSCPICRENLQSRP